MPWSTLSMQVEWAPRMEVLNESKKSNWMAVMLLNFKFLSKYQNKVI